jgi:preprotein translocase subunit SecA
MIDATLVSALNTESVPQFIISEYELSSVGTDSTSDLFSIPLLSRTINETSYRSELNTTVGGEAYIINLVSFSISCESTNFDVHVLDISDVSYLNSINEVLTYLTNNKLKVDHSFDNYVIRNKDTVLSNNLYIFIDNNDTVETGTIRVSLTYNVLQDRTF